MATIEKLIKAFEALKVFQPVTTTVEEVVTKKKDQPLSKKDKIASCNLVADCICAVNMRSVQDFPKFLGISMETFLNLCDDQESDIRMVADECLNRTIKTLLETNLGRLQVELYKEIKKNGSARCLRAALWRFAEMAHLIRPQKCRPYIVNLLPCLTKICRREDEGIQEMLLVVMAKICPALMGFATDNEVKVLIKAFLPNLKSKMASCRRAAATCLTLICQYSRSPPTFIKFLLDSLLELVLPVDSEVNNLQLVGAIMCVRNLMPLLMEHGEEGLGMRGSFGETKHKKVETVTTNQLVIVYQLLVHHLSHPDHNVVTSCLEALQQLLRTPPAQLRPILMTDGGIRETFIYKKDIKGLHIDVLAGIPSTSQLSVASEDAGLDEESESCDIKGQSEALTEDLDQSVTGEQQLTQRNTESLKENVKESDMGLVMTCDSEYSSVEIGDINDDASERSDLSKARAGSQETLLSIKSLSPTHGAEGASEIVGQDMNGNPEIEAPESESSTSSTVEINNKDILENIGSPTEGLPILYCVRMVCGRFLMTGRKGELMPDRNVRVSLKNLAMGCVASAVKIYPTLFLEKLTIGGDKEPNPGASIQDVLLYAGHPDPQLKGVTSQIIGNFLSAALTEGRGNFNKWVQARNVPSLGVWSLESLMEPLLCITEDCSSVAARLAVSALGTILPQLLHSYHGDAAIKGLLKLLQVKDNSYWLVKVEVLELVQGLDFKVVRHLESTHGPPSQQAYLGSIRFQDHILEELVYVYVWDEDGRVRRAAANTIIKLVEQLFFPVDYPHQDPVIAVARDNVNHFLSPIMHDWCLQPPPCVQGLVSQYHVTPGLVVQSSVESALSRIVTALLRKLNMAQTKHQRAGCIQCLCALSERYLTSVYPHAWGCAVHSPLWPRETATGYKRPPNRTLSASSTFSLEELTNSSGGGPLPTVLALLTSTAVTLDLATHQHALQLAGNLIAGSAYRSLRSQEHEHTKPDSQSEEGVWPALANRLLVPLIDHLLTHVARVLNAFSHVIDEQSPGPPQMKTALPSLPNAPSLSPIKRKNKVEKDTGSTPGNPSSDGKGMPKPAQKAEKERDSDKDKGKKDGLGTFYTLPHYVKFYETLKGAFSNYKISLDLSSTDKFCLLLKTTLTVLCQILEVATLADIGKYAEEFLVYLKSSITLEPTDTVLSVQQLLKALFGTNLCSQWEQHSALLGGRSSRPGGRDGLYQGTFTRPYSQFTQSLAAATIKAVSPDYEDTTGMLTYLKKCVERKVPAILKPSSKADKTAIAAYIRLFEPLVIKALKQYTVTSSLPLQQQVLDLLSQLVQLRVNYCLLDSDQVFIGFVIKQFEYIEEGQIRKSDTLIPNIFNFLVMLSYEKFHSKPVITMPKIIQLCDGIMASGLDPTTHAIPALQPIVHDLFLLRGSNKADISKELETQREVIVSMLLRLISFHQAIDMFVIVLQQCHRENEDRWKRMSRQVTDTLLPALAKQQIELPDQVALDAVHRLFESVAPIVFRPVDILLKTLLMKPPNISSVRGLELWMCLVLAILRVLMAQTKEEVVLSRIHELNLQLQVLRQSDGQGEGQAGTGQRQLLSGLKTEEIMARFFLQMIGCCVSKINQSEVGTRSCDFLCQQLSHLLMYITHMFQSGSFRRVATASIQCIRQPPSPCFYGIQDINSEFLLLGNSQPTLTLQWCNVLILLNFSDQAFWSEVVKTPKKYVMATNDAEREAATNRDVAAATKVQHRCNDEILRRGGLILFCDYACENLNDSEHLTWVLINHVRDLIDLSLEEPVQDFISAIHRNSAASSLFIQAIHTRWEDVKNPALVMKTLKCLDAVHFSQSGALLTLLIDRFLNTHHLSVSRACDSIACRRVEMLLAESPQERVQQLPLDDLDKLLTFMQTHGLTRKHTRLLSLLGKFRDSIADNTSSPMGPSNSELQAFSADLIMSKESYMRLVQCQCFRSTVNASQCAKLLQNLGYADMLAVLMTKEFNLTILEECIQLGTKRSLHQYSRESEAPATGNQQVEWTLDPLFQASQLTLMRHISNLINLLPVPHEILNFSDLREQRTSKYVEKIEDFFSEPSSVEVVFSLTSSLLQYLVSLSVLPWKPKVPSESQRDICRFSTFCLECIGWLLSNHSMPTGEHLATSLQCVSAVLQNSELCILIGQKDHVTLVCSITSAVHLVVSSLCVLPGKHMCIHIRREETPAKSSRKDDHLDSLTRACDEITELVQYALEVRGPQVTPSVIGLPRTLSHLVTQLIIGLSRLPVLNSFARTPPIVWKMGWIPTPSGEPKTKLPPLPLDLMLDKEVLKEFVLRNSIIGWISRQQFEETWMSLLGVLNPDASEHEISPEEEVERTHCMVLAVRAITGMLVQTMIVPTPGNPTQGTFDVQPRDKPLAFLHTRCGKKLTVIRGHVEQELNKLTHGRPGKGFCRGGVKYMFDANLERDVAVDDYSLGQVSIESIWSVVGVLDSNLSDSETTDSMESSSHQDLPLASFGAPGTSSVTNLATSLSEDTITRDTALYVAGLDVHSCLQFLLELYRQWLLPNGNNKPSLMLLNEVIKSVVCLSDLFAEREQFDWLLDTLFEVYKSQPNEDEISLQYLTVGVCKAAAVVGVDNTSAERLVKIIDANLRSTHIPSRLSALHGVLYLLEANIQEVSRQLVPLMTDYLLKTIQSQIQLAVYNERFMLTLWATAFYLLENYSSETRDTDFPAHILQLAITMASSNEESITTTVYLAILKGLERLLLTDVLTSQDADLIVKLSVDSLKINKERLCLPSPQRSLAALGLLFTCMYSGKQYDGYSPRPRDQETFTMEEPNDLLQDPESLILAMERVTVLFDRIKKGYPYEAGVISTVLPAFLVDFFPAQDIMNKVIGEFLSSQQPYPHLIAGVVFQVFSNLHEQRQHGLLRDWVMLSLSNFTQRTPVAMAMWSLTCFFISASTNTWLRNLLSYVLMRMGKIESVDRRLFCLSAMDFYRQLSDETSRRTFHQTFQNAGTNQPESPYTELLDFITKS
ncbi:huntingtin-like isoform X2 [Mya arenaria]|uniref:huntingtin-like isoform X2 n=1 Tax=Mya arenaria TaxID=6604 RepID=UPI0022E906AF|nr:huntingtin-like isoform X2 [Mya arenaria]